jgi:hypothetical protein
MQEGIFECEFRFQHTKPLVDSMLMVITNNQLLIKLATPLRAITPGQVNKALPVLYLKMNLILCSKGVEFARLTTC